TGLDDLVMPGSGWFTPDSHARINATSKDEHNVFWYGQQRLLKGRVLGDGTANGSSRLLSLPGPPLEWLLMTPQQTMLAQTSSPDTTGALPETKDQASPMRMQSVVMRRVVERLRSRLKAYECQYDSMFSDDILMGLAQRLASGKPIMHTD